MDLKYHQATFDLLTQNQIDPAKAIEQSQRLSASFSSEHDRQEREAWEEKYCLRWTRLKLYQHPLQVSEMNIQQLTNLEQQYNVVFPASVREWYSLDIGPDMLSISNVGYPINELSPLSEKEYDKSHVWCFMHHEYIDQGGEPIVFKIDEGDDPPVYAEYGDDFIELAPTFSSFLYLHFWDWYSQYTFEFGFSLLHHPAIESLQISIQYHVPFSQLRQHYQELKGTQQTRFYNDKMRLWVGDNRIWEEGRGTTIVDKDIFIDGTLRTYDVETLREVIKTIWGDNAPVFNMTTYDDASEAAIEHLMYSQLLRVLNNIGEWINEGELGQMLGSTRPRLSGPMQRHIKQLIASGQVEFDKGDSSQETRYRLKPLLS